MTTGEMAFLLFGLVVLATLPTAGWYQWRRASRRRLVNKPYISRTAAEIRRDELRKLPREMQDWYADEWRKLQARFVNTPAEALGVIDELVIRLIADRGGHDQRALAGYRQAHEITKRAGADTDELRHAMTHYRAVMAELLDSSFTPEGLR